MKPNSLLKLLVGGTAIAATPFLLVRADISPPEKKPEAGALGSQLQRFLEGFGSALNDDQKKELDKALDQFRQSEEPGQPRGFRWEWRSDGQPSENDAAPKKRARVQPGSGGGRNLDRNTPDTAGDQLEQMREQMRRSFPGLDLDRLFEDDFFGPFLQDLNRAQPGAPNSERPWFQDRRDGDRRSARYEKAARRAMAEFRPVVKDARESVVTLYDQDGEQVALATIVSADGHALTKASVLGDGKGLEAEFSDGRVVEAKLLDALKSYDLALIKIEATDLKPIVWNPSEKIEAGTLLAAASPDEDPLAIGVVSVAPRSLDSTRKGFLGVRMDGVEGGVKVTQITPGSAAQKAGLKEGDLITAIDGAPVKSPRELTDIITRKLADDEVHIGYRRGTEDKVAVATLQSRDSLTDTLNGRPITETERKEMARNADPTARMGGRGSTVADGFPLAFQNDLLIEPNECGGPAVDIDGRALGLNIARAERTKTYAVPASALVKLLAKATEGKLNEPKDLGDLKREARRASSEVDALEEQLKAARERAKAADAAIEEKAK